VWVGVCKRERERESAFRKISRFLDGSIHCVRTEKLERGGKEKG
jgi:hypothetical protein